MTSQGKLKLCRDRYRGGQDRARLIMTDLDGKDKWMNVLLYSNISAWQDGPDVRVKLVHAKRARDTVAQVTNFIIGVSDFPFNLVKKHCMSILSFLHKL